jgi:FecR protein
MTPGLNFSASRRIATTIQGVGNLRRRGRQALALCIAAAMLSIPALVVFGSPSSGVKTATGQIVVHGDVTVNSTPATTGQTLFSGSTISTNEDSQSLVELGNTARLRLNPETSLAIGFSESSVSGTLTKGSVDYISPAGVSAVITTADGVIVPDSNGEAQFQVQMLDGKTFLSVTTGKVEMRNGDTVRSVSAGESASTAPGSALPPQQNGMSDKKKWGLIILFGGVGAIIIWAIVGKDSCKVFSPAGSTNCIDN